MECLLPKAGGGGSQTRAEAIEDRVDEFN